MASFFPLEENNAFDGDRKFGSNLSADIDGATRRHFTFDGNSLGDAQISIGGSAASTVAVVGQLSFHNRLSGGTDKRLASIRGEADGAHDQGALSFRTSLAGVAFEHLRLDKDGNLALGISAIVSFDPSANNAVRRLIVDGGTGALPAQISAGTTQAGTANLVGLFNFFNRSIAAAEKRVATINAVTDGATNTARLSISMMAAGALLERLRIMGNGTIAMGMQGAIATNATGGFVGIPQCAGAPTGVPAGPGVNMAYIVYDTTNNKLWCYNTIAAAWKGAVHA